MRLHTFKIRTKAAPQDAYVEIDGKRLEGVTRISFDISSERWVTLRLEVLAQIEVDGEFREQSLLNVCDPPLIAPPGAK